MVFLLALLPSLPLSPDSTNQLVGTWLGRDSSTRGVTQIVITNENGVLRAHSWSGACAPTDCHWGVTEVTLNEGTPMATFNEGSRYNDDIFRSLAKQRVACRIQNGIQGHARVQGPGSRRIV
jgi:hypothetical protein